MNRTIFLFSVILLSISTGCREKISEKIKLYSKIGNADTVNTIEEYTVTYSNEGIIQTLKETSLIDSTFRFRKFLLIEEDSSSFTKYLMTSTNKKIILNKYILIEDSCYFPSALSTRRLKPDERIYCFVSMILDTIIDSTFYTKAYLFNRYAIGESYHSRHIYDSNFVPIKEWYVEGFGKAFETDRIPPKTLPNEK